MEHRLTYSSRERMQRTIRHEATDRVPKGELCIADAVITRVLNCRQVGFEERLAFVNELGLDSFTISPVCHCEKEQVSNPDAPPWPDIEKWTVKTALFTFVIVDGAFETGMSTHEGLKFLTFMRKSPSSLKSFIEQVEKRNISRCTEAAEKGVDGVILADDVAFAGGLIINPQTWREDFLPSLARQVEAIDRLGLTAFYHSDGNYLEIIPELVDIGFKGLQCLERRCGMDMANLQNAYGEQICLWGHIDTEDTLKAHDQDYLEVFSASLKKLSRRKGLILGTNCGLYEGTGMAGLKAIYRSME